MEMTNLSISTLTQYGNSSVVCYSMNISLKRHSCPVNLASAPKGSKNTIQMVYVICLQTYYPEVCQGPTIEYLSYLTWCLSKSSL